MCKDQNCCDCAYIENCNQMQQDNVCLACGVEIEDGTLCQLCDN